TLRRAILSPEDYLIVTGQYPLKQKAGAGSRFSDRKQHLNVKTAGLVSVKKHEKSVRSPEARGRPRPSTLLYCADYKSNPVFRQGCTFYGVLDFGTPKACWDIRQAYAFLAYAWSVSETKDAFSFQGYAKSAYPRLSFWHRSAVR